MTAVVGILNKSGLAIAADSAVTLTSFYKGQNKTKILNTANKIFTLSKYHPVGIAIYSQASINRVPWEIIIKEYRRQLGKDSFPTVREYFEDFVKFINSSAAFFFDQSTQESFLLGQIKWVIKEIVGNTFKSIGENPQKFDLDDASNRKRLSDSIILELKRLNAEINSDKSLVVDELIGLDEFIKEYKEKVISISSEASNLLVTLRLFENSKFVDGLLLFFHSLINTNNVDKAYTGLVFVGYGEKELFPSCFPIKCYYVFRNKLKYVLDDEWNFQIGDKRESAIATFAQTDVMNTILMGVDSKLEDLFYENTVNLVNDISRKIKENLSNPEIIDEVINEKVKDDLFFEYINLMRGYQQENYITPLLSSLATISKEDLAEMAESLVYLTYLKRRMTNEEESVGGPVDVAVISKGDGFVWIKRKHYFDPKLNQPFLNDYFNR